METRNNGRIRRHEALLPDEPKESVGQEDALAEDEANEAEIVNTIQTASEFITILTMMQQEDNVRGRYLLRKQVHELAHELEGRCQNIW